MLEFFTPGSPALFVLLILCLALVLFFEFSNGFHDTANAVATVIYTHSLKATQAVLWSGVMNFIGVLVGGIAVAYALVEIIPPDVLTPPDGALAVGMLVALTLAALTWNVGTWWLGIPNSSSHALVGALIGIALEYGFVQGHSFTGAVNWHQVSGVLSALLISPLLGFGFSFTLYRVIRRLIPNRELYQAPIDGNRPTWWLRGLLVVTCTGVSFAHGTNDGQKSIGFIMLAIIGLMPQSYALNEYVSGEQLAQSLQILPQSIALFQQVGDQQREAAINSAQKLRGSLTDVRSIGAIPSNERAPLRHQFNVVIAELSAIAQKKSVTDAQRHQAKTYLDSLTLAVQYAPWWVRILSALCLGAGTMIGYKRIVKTLGEGIGRVRMSPMQGGTAEAVASILIASAGFTGLPVSTTHVVTAGIAGAMVGSGAGLQPPALQRIAIAWILTLPGTMVLSAFFFYALS
ncbi:inorganic phosphate transporter [Bradyrhizobium sp. USDA 4451]